MASRSHTKHVRSNMPAMRARLAALKRVEVTIGVHAQEGRSPDGTSRALIASVHEYGSADVPARPFLGPAIDEHREELHALMKRVATAHVMRGVPLHPALRRVGLQSEVWVRRRIDSKIGPPLSAATIAKRESRLGGRGARNTSFTGWTPLRDTSMNLYNALRSVVSQRGGAS